MQTAETTPWVSRAAARFTMFLMLLFVTLTSPAFAADIPKASDHPLISRYAGSEIIDYHAVEFGQVEFPLSKVADKRNAPAKVAQAEGRVFRITYRAPAQRSALEIQRNFEQALRGAGFQVLFSCANAACGNGMSFALNTLHQLNHNEKDQHYLIGTLKSPQGEVHASVFTVGAYSLGGVNKDRALTQLTVVETKSMDSGKVAVSADTMARQIASQGRVALYGIYFDSDKTEIKAESKPELEEIAKLLKQNPAMKLLVVGHTDNAGKFDYNIDLSKRRAQAVTDTLTSQYGIAAARLKPWGNGLTAPVASNRTEEGRAKNRRVELVEQ